MQNPDFRFEGFLQPDGSVTPTPSPGVVHKVNLGTHVNVAAPIMEAHRLAHLIKQKPVGEWKQAILDAPQEHQERIRGVLVKEWEQRKGQAERAANQRRRESGGHHCAAGDAALAELAKKFGSPK